MPPQVPPNQGAPQTPPSLVSKLESFLKLGAASAGLAAAMGLPAVYLHLSNYQIPTHIVGFEGTFKAGVLPGLMLGAYLFYANSSLKRLHDVTDLNEINLKLKLYAILPIGALTPFVILAALIFVVGAVAYMILGIWVYSYAFIWLLGLVTNISVASKSLYFFSIVIALLIGVFWAAVYFIGDRIPGLRKIRTIVMPWLYDRRKPAYPESSRKPAAKSQLNEKRNGNETAAQEDESRLILIIISVATVFIFAYMTLFLYCIRWSLQILEVSWYEEFTFIRIASVDILTIIIAGVLALVIAATRWTASTEKKKRDRGVLSILFVAATIVIGSVSLYTTHLYPLIPTAFGGGKPENISLWIKASSAPMKLRDILGGRCRLENESIVQCNNIYLLYKDSDSIVLSSHAGPSTENHQTKGVILGRDDIVAISWP